MVAGKGLEPHDLRVFPAAKRLCPACGSRNFILGAGAPSKNSDRCAENRSLHPPLAAVAIFSQRATLVGLKPEGYGNSNTTENKKKNVQRTLFFLFWLRGRDLNHMTFGL